MHILETRPKNARKTSYSPKMIPASPRMPSSTSSRFPAQATFSHKSPMPVRKDSEVDMEDGVVDMEVYNQILALDDGDPTKEFSKALVWSWCDQAEMSVEEMELFLEKNAIEALASKAHYLKGSSSSLGLIQVSKTCQSLYHLHFPPSLAHYRTFTSSTSDSSSSSADGSSSSSSSQSPMLNGVSYKPGSVPMDFEADKIDRAADLLVTLKAQIKEASEWLCLYYHESDRYQAGMESPPLM